MAADSAVTTIPDAGVSAAPAARRQVLRGATARNTPTKLRLLLIGLLALTIVWGIVAAWTVATHDAATRNVLDVSEPLSLDAQQIYHSLSDADATEATAFLAGGLEPAALRQRYEADIARAARLLETATAAAGNSAAASRLATLAAGLPVYTGLVETARADNRLGLPLGAAYLRQASGFMRASLLPAARDLYAEENAQLAAADRKATAFPYFALAVALITAFGLVRSQVWLTRRTNRIISPGLLLASLAGLAALIWLAVALPLARTHLASARTQGSVPVEALAGADIAALRANADESLTLIDHSGDDSFQKDFLRLQKQLGPSPGSLLSAAATIARGSPGGSAAAAAAQSVPMWYAAHRRVRTLDDNGRYANAVQLATGSGPTTSGALFGRVDAALTSGIDADQAAFRAGAEAAQGDLADLEAGVIVLSILMAAGCAIAVTRRLAEYR